MTKRKSKIGVYVRVSTATKKRKPGDKGKPEFRQTTKSQRLAVRLWAKSQHIPESELTWYEDRRSGKSLKGRDALARMMKDVATGKIDCVVVNDLSRLARNLMDGLKTLAELSARVRVVSVSENIDFGNSTGQLIASILLAVAQFQRELTVEKIKAGLAAARESGKTLGRPRNNERLTAIRAYFSKHGAPATCDHFSFSRANLYRSLSKTKDAA